MVASWRRTGWRASLSEEVVGKWSVSHRFLIHPIDETSTALPRDRYPFREARQGSLELVQLRYSDRSVVERASLDDEIDFNQAGWSGCVGVPLGSRIV